MKDCETRFKLVLERKFATRVTSVATMADQGLIASFFRLVGSAESGPERRFDWLEEDSPSLGSVQTENQRTTCNSTPIRGNGCRYTPLRPTKKQNKNFIFIHFFMIFVFLRRPCWSFFGQVEIPYKNSKMT